jgi:hypothetical protein
MLEKRSFVKATVWTKSQKDHGHFVLTLGDQKFRMIEADLPAGRSWSWPGWVSQYLNPDGALNRAIAAGGSGHLDLVTGNQDVRALEDLTVPPADDLQKAVNQGYQAVSGFAADPAHSEYCSLWVK